MAAPLASCSGPIARTELRSRRSFFSRRQLLDRDAAVGRRCASRALPAVRRSGPRSGRGSWPRRSRPSRASGPGTAVDHADGGHADDPREAVPLPRLFGNRHGRAAPGSRSPSLRCRRDRARSVRVRQVRRQCQGCRGSRRLVGTRPGSMAHPSSLGRCGRRWSSLSVRACIAERMATAAARGARRHDSCRPRSSHVLRPRGRARVRGCRARCVRASPISRSAALRPPRWVDSIPKGP